MHATFYSERAKIRMEEYNVPKLKSSERKIHFSLKHLPLCITYPQIYRGNPDTVARPASLTQLFQKVIALVLQPIVS